MVSSRNFSVKREIFYLGCSMGGKVLHVAGFTGERFGRETVFFGNPQ